MPHVQRSKHSVVAHFGLEYILCCLSAAMCHEFAILARLWCEVDRRSWEKDHELWRQLMALKCCSCPTARSEAKPLINAPSTAWLQIAVMVEADLGARRTGGCGTRTMSCRDN